MIKRGGETETRYTDRPVKIGDVVNIDNRRAAVVSRHADPANLHAATRFVCRLEDEPTGNPLTTDAAYV